MRILVISSEIPTPILPDALRPFYFLKTLSEQHGHELHLLSLEEQTPEIRRLPVLEKYCHHIETIPVPEHKGLTFKSRRELTTLKNMVSIENIFSRNRSFLNPHYIPAMRRKVQESLSMHHFDVIYVHSINMACYVLNEDLPRVIDCMDATFNAFHRLYELEKNVVAKLFQWLLHHRVKRDLKRAYKANIDSFLLVSYDEKEILRSYLPNANIDVIPNGVDIDYFKPLAVDEDSPSVVFLGSLQADSNVMAVDYFYHSIYPLIREHVPDAKLYIVGRNPDKIQRLRSDQSIVITGYVEDVRPYLAQASVFVAPMIAGGGVKNKILEALAMAKPVVTTAIGAKGSEVVPNKEIIVADEPVEFAERVVELLGNKTLRQRLGRSGRMAVEKHHSWIAAGNILNELLERIASQRKA